MTRPRRSRYEQTQLDPAKLAARILSLYGDGVTQREIASRFCISIDRVVAVLKANSVTIQKGPRYT